MRSLISKNEKGFILAEALVSILLLSIVVTVLLKTIGVSLDLLKRNDLLSKRLIGAEKLLYELETGNRCDLIYYGGEEKINEIDYQVKAKQTGSVLEDGSFYDVDISTFSKNNKSVGKKNVPKKNFFKFSLYLGV